MTRRVVLLPCWIAGLVATGWVLVQIGHGQLAPPTGAGPAAIRQWAASRDPATLAMSLVRMVSLVLDGYLLLTTVTGGVARAAHWVTLVRVLDCVTPSSVRRVLAVSMGSLLLSAPLTAPAGAGTSHVAYWGHVAASPRFVATPGAIVAMPVASGPPLVRVPANAGGPTAGASRADDTTTAATTPPTDPSAHGAVATATPPPTTTPLTVIAQAPTTRIPPRPRPAPRDLVPVETWTVRPGDNCWDIARLVLVARSEVPPTPAEIAPYWASLLAVNEGRFRSGNPNVIYVGERIILPRLPPP